KDAHRPPPPADPVDGRAPRPVRHPRPLPGRGAEHAELRGEPAGAVQGDRHHARGPQLRPVPAVRGAHVPRQRQGAGEGALADDRRPLHLTRGGSTAPGGPPAGYPAGEGRGLMTRVRQAGERIEELLATLRATSGSAAAAAEELVRLLLGLYGDGLSHIMDALAAEGAPGEAILDRLLGAPLVESLLLLPHLR